MNDLFTSVLNYALARHIGVSIESMTSPYAVPLSDTDNRMILLNSRWWRPREMSFQLAHEIGHIENGDEGILKYSPMEGRIEMQANIYGVGLLVSMYFADVDKESANVNKFMDALAIPAVLHDVSEEYIYNYYTHGSNK